MDRYDYILGATNKTLRTCLDVTEGVCGRLMGK